MNYEKINVWQGPGWYACQQEYQPHCSEWHTVYYFINNNEELPDERDYVGLGTPTWFNEDF